MLIWLVVAGISKGSGSPFVIGWGALFILLGLAPIPFQLLPTLVLTTHTLRRPRMLRRAEIIPLDEVTGIGLVSIRAPLNATWGGWSLYLWTTGDVPRDVGIVYERVSWLHPAGKARQKHLAVEPSAVELARPFDAYRFSYNFNPVTQTDPDKIAATYAARAAREIYDRVVAYQGPSGLLAMQQDQKHVPVFVIEALADWRLQTAYWSPDGQFGHLTPEPQWRRSVRPANPAPRPDRSGPMLRLRYRLLLLGRKFRRRANAGNLFS